jgi:hypothetical protein
MPKMTISLTDPEHEAFEKRAQERGVTLAELAVLCLHLECSRAKLRENLGTGERPVPWEATSELAKAHHAEMERLGATNIRLTRAVVPSGAVIFNLTEGTHAERPHLPRLRLWTDATPWASEDEAIEELYTRLLDAVRVMQGRT